MGTTLSELGMHLPAPGWAVLDAIRGRRFTGQVTLIGMPPVRLWADQGRIYRAEPLGAPSLAARLVLAGAVTGDDLARGLVRVAGRDHLGALFERAPLCDRHAALLALATLTEQALRDVAAQDVAAATVEPYVFDPEGLHLWLDDHAGAPRRSGVPTGEAAWPFAAPPADAVPASAAPPPEPARPEPARPEPAPADTPPAHIPAAGTPPPETGPPGPASAGASGATDPDRRTGHDRPAGVPSPGRPDLPATPEAEAGDGGFAVIWPDGDRSPAGSGVAAAPAGAATAAPPLTSLSAATRGRLLDDRFGSDL